MNAQFSLGFGSVGEFSLSFVGSFLRNPAMYFKEACPVFLRLFHQQPEILQQHRLQTLIRKSKHRQALNCQKGHKPHQIPILQQLIDLKCTIDNHFIFSPHLLSGVFFNKIYLEM